MNMLLTCGGARSYLLESLKAAVGDDGRVFACDVTREASGAAARRTGGFCSGHRRSGVSRHTPGALPRERIDLLIPTMEHELPMLAAHRADFAAAGTTILVLRRRSWTLLRQAPGRGIPGHVRLSIPKTWAFVEDACEALACGELAFPLVVKPRWGVGSIGLSFPEDEDELELELDGHSTRDCPLVAWRRSAPPTRRAPS